jgi:hypothetical protein
MRLPTVLLASHLLAVDAGLTVSVQSNGAYAVSFDGAASWAAPLTGGAYTLRNAGTTYRSADGSLAMVGAPRPTSGADQLGSYTGYSITWNQAGYQTNFYQYASLKAAPQLSGIVFEQVIPYAVRSLSAHASGLYW